MNQEVHLTDEPEMAYKKSKTDKSNDVFQGISGSLYSSLPYHLGMLKKAW